jgi:hypothetical protein
MYMQSICAVIAMMQLLAIELFLDVRLRISLQSSGVSSALMAEQSQVSLDDISQERAIPSVRYQRHRALYGGSEVSKLYNNSPKDKDRQISNPSAAGSAALVAPGPVIPNASSHDRDISHTRSFLPSPRAE